MLEQNFLGQPARVLNVKSGGVKGAGAVQDFVLQPSGELGFALPRLSQWAH